MKSDHGETTLTVFSIRTTKDTYVGSVIMEIQAWSRTAAQANLVTKGRQVAVDGQLTQNEYLSPEGRKQTRTPTPPDHYEKDSMRCSPWPASGPARHCADR